MQPDAKSQAFSTSLATPSRCQKSVGSARRHKVYRLLDVHCPAGSILRFQHRGPLRLSSAVRRLKGHEQTPPMTKPNGSPLEPRLSDRDRCRKGRARIVWACVDQVDLDRMMREAGR